MSFGGGGGGQQQGGTQVSTIDPYAPAQPALNQILSEAGTIYGQGPSAAGYVAPTTQTMQGIAAQETMANAANQQILQKVKYEESKKLDSGTITVEIKALDKITAKTSTLSIKLGEEKYFGNLKIKPLKCKASDIDQPPDTVAYLQVIDTSDKKNDQVFVFNGWTFASSPTLRSLDHAIYDLWLLGCSNT